MQKQIELRRAVQRLERRGRGRRYPEQLRKKLIAYIRSRRQAGITVAALGEELGMSWRTVSRWTAGRFRGGGFRRVQIVEPQPPPTGLTVRGGCGVRVEGLKLEQVAELLRRLG